ncbi:hypothetical protein R50072_10810 [Simiduia litorea]|uniref:hypothetical protein n=1 Tax=Simiduia litorea TaxID=1435348 RepID=UPI0036F3B821
MKTSTAKQLDINVEANTDLTERSKIIKQTTQLRTTNTTTGMPLGNAIAASETEPGICFPRDQTNPVESAQTNGVLNDNIRTAVRTIADDMNDI